MDEGDLPLVDLVKRQLALASAARTEIALTTDGLPEETETPAEEAVGTEEPDNSDEALRKKAQQLRGPSEAAKALFTPYVVDFETNEMKDAGSSNTHFKLLMRLLNWENTSGTLFPELVLDDDWQRLTLSCAKQHQKMTMSPGSSLPLCSRRRWTATSR